MSINDTIVHKIGVQDFACDACLIFRGIGLFQGSIGLNFHRLCMAMSMLDWRRVGQLTGRHRICSVGKDVDKLQFQALCIVD